MNCKFCGAKMMADIDDNFTQIQCPECGQWQGINDHGLDTDPETKPLHESEGC